MEAKGKGERGKGKGTNLDKAKADSGIDIPPDTCSASGLLQSPAFPQPMPGAPSCAVKGTKPRIPGLLHLQRIQRLSPRWLHRIENLLHHHHHYHFHLHRPHLQTTQTDRCATDSRKKPGCHPLYTRASCRKGSKRSILKMEATYGCMCTTYYWAR